MMALMESGAVFAIPRVDNRAMEGLERSGASEAGLGSSGSMVRSSEGIQTS